MNERIRAREVRLIDENGAQVGILENREAVQFARDRGLDLIEVAPNGKPPVCRVMDYGKYRYEQGKREREAQKKQRMGDLKGIRMRPGIDEHDFQFKLRHAEKFLQEGAKVNAYVFFKGRSILFKEQGEILLLRLASELEEVGKLDQMPKLEGKRMTIFISPKKIKK